MLVSGRERRTTSRYGIRRSEKPLQIAAQPSIHRESQPPSLGGQSCRSAPNRLPIQASTSQTMERISAKDYRALVAKTPAAPRDIKPTKKARRAEGRRGGKEWVRTGRAR